MISICTLLPPRTDKAPIFRHLIVLLAALSLSSLGLAKDPCRGVMSGEGDQIGRSESHIESTLKIQAAMREAEAERRRKAHRKAMSVKTVSYTHLTLPTILLV